MAKIEKFHVSSCSGDSCECLWELDYRPLGLCGPRRRVRFRTRSGPIATIRSRPRISMGGTMGKRKRASVNGGVTGAAGVGAVSNRDLVENY